MRMPFPNVSCAFLMISDLGEEVIGGTDGLWQRGFVIMSGLFNIFNNMVLANGEA